MNFYLLLIYPEKEGGNFSKILLTLHQTTLHCFSDGSNRNIHWHNNIMFHTHGSCKSLLIGQLTDISRILILCFRETEFSYFGLVSVFPKNQLPIVHALSQKYDATRNRSTFTYSCQIP
jgi:hypothetical protein